MISTRSNNHGGSGISKFCGIKELRLSTYSTNSVFGSRLSKDDKKTSRS